MLVLKVILTFALCGKLLKVVVEQHAATFNYFRKIWPKFPGGFWEKCSILPVHGKDSTNMASLSGLCKHGMALITDAYFGVTSEAACCLYQCFVFFPGWRPALGKAHAEYYTVFNWLSPQQAAPFLLYTRPSILYLLQKEPSNVWVFFKLAFIYCYFYCFTTTCLVKWMENMCVQLTSFGEKSFLPSFHVFLWRPSVLCRLNHPMKHFYRIRRLPLLISTSLPHLFVLSHAHICLLFTYFSIKQEPSLAQFA